VTVVKKREFETFCTRLDCLRGEVRGIMKSHSWHACTRGLNRRFDMIAGVARFCWVSILLFPKLTSLNELGRALRACKDVCPPRWAALCGSLRRARTW
jgi:hypothetical protein